MSPRGWMFDVLCLPLYIYASDEQVIIEVQNHQSRISESCATQFLLLLLRTRFTLFLSAHIYLRYNRETRVVTKVQSNTKMAVARLLLTISALISVISLQVVYGGMVCEKLPVEVCAFSVSSSGARCVLEKSISSDLSAQYECQTSEIIVENMNELIETEECMNACGVKRMTVGMSTDTLAERGFTKKLCSPQCYNDCPNIINLYFNLAAGEGIYLPRLCEAHRSGDRRMISEVLSESKSSIAAESFAVAPATIGFGDLTVSPASAPSPVSSI